MMLGFRENYQNRYLIFFYWPPCQSFKFSSCHFNPTFTRSPSKWFGYQRHYFLVHGNTTWPHYKCGPGRFKMGLEPFELVMIWLLSK